MAVLHLIGGSPTQSRSLEQCLMRIGDGDGLLLIENGVYAGVLGTESAQRLQNAPAGVRCYVLQPDLQARGVNVSDLLPQLKPVGYDGFVELTLAYPLIQSW